MVNFGNLEKKILEKPENTIISSSICFVFNSKEFESIQKDSNLESVPRLQPFFDASDPLFHLWESEID